MMFDIVTKDKKLQGNQAILFDLDGTLIDSVPDIAQAAINTSLELSGPEITQEQIRVWIGRGVRSLVERVLKQSTDEPITTQMIQHASEVFMRHYMAQGAELTQLYPGAKAFLEALNAHHVPVALVTNKPYKITLEVLHQLDIKQHFQVIYGADSVPNCKPAPDMLLEAAQVLNVPIQHCVMVGDSYNDVQAARHANMSVMGLQGGYNHGESIETSDPDLVFESLAALYQSIEFRV